MLLEIDWQGARQVRKSQPDCVSVFVLPPSREELERRLRTRAADNAATIARRLADSREEIAHAGDFDYIIVNDQFADALADLRAIVTARRLRREAQMCAARGADRRSAETGVNRSARCWHRRAAHRLR